jgi:hypothetical protein
MMEDIGPKSGPSVPTKAKSNEAGAEKLGTGVSEIFFSKTRLIVSSRR